MSETQNNGNKNQNRNQNRQGGNRNGNNNNRNKQNGNNRNRQNQNRNHNSGQKRPTPKPLTFWQKILALFGIKPAQQPQRSSQQNNNKSNQSNNKPARSNNKPANTDNKGPKPAVKKARQPLPVEVTSGRLYVGNLSYETTEYDLEELFKGNGAVKGVEIIYNRHTHKSKGYGFVEMRNIDEAKNAVKVHHDQPFMGRNMIVNGAKNRQDNHRERTPKGDNQSAA